jgi:DNA polymerase-3 subunit gamma/tau
MSYQVIARKWRPQAFDEIVGQEHVTTTLKNSIASGRIGHAYLFTGIRGCGKTTAARVLAKALNCVRGPTPEPCNQCDSCTEITRGSSLDVKEIDGASNRGIDSIRELREGVAFAAARDRYRIYIIDEVHMLTGEAFNALLKTLEEPPPHVIFLFATTEQHKVPATILSRCQVFEFKRITLGPLAERLRLIVEAEGIEVSDEALRAIAREADGSLRDASSLLDQVISFASGPIGMQDVAQILRTGNRGLVLRTLNAVLGEDPAEALRAFQDASDRGAPPRQFLRDLARVLAECMKAVLLGRDAALETGLTETEVAERVAAVRGRPPEFLASLLHGIVVAADRASDSRSPDLLAQAALVRASRMSSLTQVDGLVARLEALSGGAPLPREFPSRTPGPAPAAPPPSLPREAVAGPATAAVDRLHRAFESRPAAPVARPVASPALTSPRPAAPAPPPQRTVEQVALDRMRKHPLVERVMTTFGCDAPQFKPDVSESRGQG